MPIVETSPYTTPYLIHDAPVNEKTKKIREMFKVDEETGYPEHYNWRPMARLGKTYQPQDPFKKFDPYNPEETISQKVAMVALAAGATFFAHICFSMHYRRPLLSHCYKPIAGFFVLTGAGFWWQEMTLTRQAIRNSIVIDYTQRHPERFGEIYRPKIREVLSEYVPIR